MPTTIDDIPVFTFVGTVGQCSFDGAPLKSSQKHVGTISTVTDLKRLVPSPITHIEIELGKDAAPEVRVVQSLSGDFHSCTGDDNRTIIQALQDETAALYRHSIQHPGTLFPGMPDYFEHEDDVWNVLVTYDHEGHRVLPLLTAAKETITSEEDFWTRASLPNCGAFVTEDFAGIGDRRAGQITFVSEGIQEAVIHSYNVKVEAEMQEEEELQK